ncbi:hypothetical protein ACFO0N_04055 [Halobium salinum]|uniref:DUF2064 domain-containing protein n=1 Tax=Halobium salinum TaxID=1364940 RepID=A0ABD5P8D4_9EURY|nr:hypothetical protein [Halobium salinum]
MTVIAVLASPPRPGLVLPELAADGPLTESEAAKLYAAMLRDTFAAVDNSGGDLLVNYRADEGLPEEYAAGDDEESAEAELRALVADELGGTGDARFEVQVGSSFAARAGNTVTHLLRDESVASAAVVRGTAPFLFRSVVDSAAMKLRRSPVVLGPSTEGRTYYAGFTEPIDFDGAFAVPELETLTTRAADAGHAADFLQTVPTLERPEDLTTVLPLLESRVAAERIVPVNTATCVRDLGLQVVDGDDGPEVVRADN